MCFPPSCELQEEEPKEPNVFLLKLKVNREHIFQHQTNKVRVNSEERQQRAENGGGSNSKNMLTDEEQIKYDCRAGLKTLNSCKDTSVWF